MDLPNQTLIDSYPTPFLSITLTNSDLSLTYPQPTTNLPLTLPKQPQ